MDAGHHGVRGGVVRGRSPPVRSTQADASSDSGHYAIVLVTSRHLKVLASYVLQSIPKRLRGRFV